MVDEITRRREVVGIFPSVTPIARLISAIFLEQTDEWAVQRAPYITLETIAQINDDPLVGLPAICGTLPRPTPVSSVIHAKSARARGEASDEA